MGFSSWLRLVFVLFLFLEKGGCVYISPLFAGNSRAKFQLRLKLQRLTPKSIPSSEWGG